MTAIPCRPEQPRACFCLALAFLTLAPASAQNLAPLPIEELLPLTRSERARLLGGKVLVKALAATSPLEVAIAGAIRLEVPPDFFLSQYRDIVTFKRGPQVLQIGVFGLPSSPADLRTLTWDDADIQALKDCKAGECGVKLSADAMRGLHDHVDWNRPDHPAQVQARMRELLADYLAHYKTAGNPALMRYDDKTPPVLLSKEFQSILEACSGVLRLAPEFKDYLLNYPGRALEGAESFFYWSKESFGLKPVVSLTHVTADHKTRGGREWILIASKQLYASHYFEGSLGLTVLIGDITASSSRSCWMVYLNRSRADGLGGWLGPVKRALVSRRLSSGMTEEIERIRARVESNYVSRAVPLAP